VIQIARLVLDYPHWATANPPRSLSRVLWRKITLQRGTASLTGFSCEHSIPPYPAESRGSARAHHGPDAAALNCLVLGTDADWSREGEPPPDPCVPPPKLPPRGLPCTPLLGTTSASSSRRTPATSSRRTKVPCSTGRCLAAVGAAHAGASAFVSTRWLRIDDPGGPAGRERSICAQARRPPRQPGLARLYSAPAPLGKSHHRARRPSQKKGEGGRSRGRRPALHLQHHRPPRIGPRPGAAPPDLGEAAAGLEALCREEDGRGLLLCGLHMFLRFTRRHALPPLAPAFTGASRWPAASISTGASRWPAVSSSLARRARRAGDPLMCACACREEDEKEGENIVKNLGSWVGGIKL
jgi:hypothetical protein